MKWSTPPSSVADVGSQWCKSPQASWDSSGTLWVAGPRRLPALGGASSVARVVIGSDGKALSQDVVYADDGEGIAAATSAVRTDGHLFIGSSRDNKLLDCAVK